MTKKKENKHKFITFPRWFFIGVIVIFVVFGLSTMRILSQRAVFPSLFKISPTPERIPITVHPLDAGLSEEEYISMSTDDLSKLQKVEKSAIIVKTVEKKDWSDTSLGCPQKGMFYAQVITPGFLITLQESGKDYIYHTGSKRVILCSGN